jgi:hypothetical protein
MHHGERLPSSKQTSAAAPARKFRFYREDFPDLVTVPLHMDLLFDVKVSPS